MKKKTEQPNTPWMRVVIFILIFIPYFIFMSYMCKPVVYNTKNIAGLYGEKKNTMDVVYLGGSACFIYYAPLMAWEDYGFVAYDYAADTMQAEMYPYMIKEVIKTQKPKLLVIDARPFEYRDNPEKEEEMRPTEVSYHKFLTGMRLSKNKIDTVKDNVNQYLQEDTLPFYLDIMKYHKSINFLRSFAEDLGPKLKMIFGVYKNPYRGFYMVTDHETQMKNDFETTKEAPISEEAQEILLDLLAYLKTVDTKCLFVVCPYTEKKENKMKYNTIQKIVEEAGFDFLDANDYIDEMQLDFARDFYNFDHVNIFGAEKYTDFLNQFITKQYDLPNHQKDAQYDFMNRNLESFHHEVATKKEEIEKLIAQE